VLQHETRDALCLKCVAATSGGFEEEIKTVPGIRLKMPQAARG